MQKHQKSLNLRALFRIRDGTIGGDGAGGAMPAVSRGASNVSRRASSSVGGGSPALTPMGTSATLGGGSKAKILRPLATYGQAFWGGQPVIADEASEIITLPRKKWAQTTNTAEKVSESRRFPAGNVADIAGKGWSFVRK
jgi:hypothetical protein